MATGEGVAGADLNVTPSGIHELSSEISTAQSNFEAAVEKIDKAIKDIAGQAMSEDSTDYQAFVARYEAQMKPKAEEISNQLSTHAKNADTTAINAEETISANMRTIG